MSTIRYIEILDSFYDSIAILNKQGSIIETNKTWKEFSLNNSGAPDKTGVGVNYLEVCQSSKGDDTEIALRAREGILKVVNRNLKYFEIEYPCHSPDEKRWFLLRAVPLENSDEYTLVSHINITSRKVAELEAEHKNAEVNNLNKSLKTTLYKIVHDIQAPLNSIKGIIHLNRSDKSTLTIEKVIELIDTSVKSLGIFIQETLRNALPSGQRETESIRFEILLDEILTSIKYSELTQRIPIQTEIKQDVTFFSNTNKLRTVLSNLITNALKYSDSEKESPFVKIYILINKKEAVFLVKDNGRGIVQEELTKIFDYKFQSNENSPGAGIGLHLVKSTVESLHGTIEVESVYKAGTEFTCRIPNN